MPSGSGNKYMSGLVNAQENGAFIPIFCQLKNPIVGDVIAGTRGYINRPANSQFGNAASNREWSVFVERLDILYSANS